MRNQLSKIKICFNLKVCFQLKNFFENFQILREVVWTVKWTPAYPSTKLTNYQQPIHLQIFPSCLFKWMLQTSRHFTANHFSVNHPWQEHFLSNNNVLPLRKLALIQNCDVTCKMFSVVAKMSVMDTYNPTENLVKIDELSLIISLPFLTIRKSHGVSCHSSYSNLWKVQTFCLAEEFTFCINKYVYYLT